MIILFFNTECNKWEKNIFRWQIVHLNMHVIAVIVSIEVGGCFLLRKKKFCGILAFKRREDCDQVQSSVRQAYWLALFCTWPDTLTPLSLYPHKYSFLKFTQSHRCPSNIPNPLVCLLSSYKIQVELSKAVPWVSWWPIHLWLETFSLWQCLCYPLYVCISVGSYPLLHWKAPWLDNLIESEALTFYLPLHHVLQTVNKITDSCIGLYFLLF